MTFFDDLAPAFKTNEITFKEKRQETEGLYTFIFEPDTGFEWKAGQHGIFQITHKKIKKAVRPFSVASAPFEKVIQISAYIPPQPSEFKQALMELEPGMKMKMRGPVGPLYVDHDKPSLLIAGGIGITPFRAILKEVERSQRKNVQLLYSDSKNTFLYKKELDAIPSLKVEYVSTRDSFYQKLNHFMGQHSGEAVYYLGGPKSMVDAVSAHLKAQNIPKRNIKKDAFLGYQ